MPMRNFLPRSTIFTVQETMHTRSGEAFKKAIANRSGIVTLREVKKFDVYSKVHEDYRVHTRSGGMVSLLSMFAILLLFLTELSGYLNPEVVDHIIVDTTLDQRLPIGVNITFPSLHCEDVYVDTIDSRQEAHADVHGSMQKTVINADWSIGQESDAGKDGTGCRIHGEILVGKVTGNFHVALGKAKVFNGKLIHVFNFSDAQEKGFNTSHHIHHLTFGEQVHDMKPTLAGTAKIVNHGAFMFHYYVDLVPTLYTASDGTIVYTHQYAITEQHKSVMSNGKFVGLPGVFFVYRFSPFMVQKMNKVKPMSHFLVSVCAIIGGVFTVTGMLDSVLYKSYMGLKRVSRQ